MSNGKLYDIGSKIKCLDLIKALEAAHCEAMERAMADVVRVDEENAKLRKTLREVADALEYDMECYTTDDEIRGFEILIAKARSATEGGGV
jgi:hypothetical protein